MSASRNLDQRTSDFGQAAAPRGSTDTAGLPFLRECRGEVIASDGDDGHTVTEMDSEGTLTSTTHEGVFAHPDPSVTFTIGTKVSLIWQPMARHPEILTTGATPTGGNAQTVIVGAIRFFTAG